MEFIVWFLVAAILAIIALYFLSPRTIYSLMQKMLRRRASLLQKVANAGKFKWPYLEAGPAYGEPVVMLHGFGGDKDNWSMYAPQIVEKYRLICPDLPGFGENDRAIDRDYDIGSQVDRLREFLDALGIQACHLGGNSMGGHIALEFALKYPEYLESLTLIDNGGVVGATKSELQTALDSGIKLLEINTLDDIKRAFDFTVYKPVPMPGQFRKVFFLEALANKDLHDRIGESVQDSIINNPVNERLQYLDIPTLIIWGRHDRVFDVSCAKLMHAKIANSKMTIMEETGHMPMVEKPKETAREQISFLEKLRRTQD